VQCSERVFLMLRLSDGEILRQIPDSSLMAKKGALLKEPKVLTLTAAVFLAGLTLIAGSSTDAPAKAGDVNEARVLEDASRGTNWMVDGGDFGERHFSVLKEITDKNVDHLGLAWWLDIDSPMGMASEPMVVDGRIYVTDSLSRVYAVDALSGHLLWRFDPKISLGLSTQNSYSARVNRGAAVWNGKVYVGTGDCRLFAIDADSGKKVWASQICDPAVTGTTGAPHVAKGKVFIGYNGSDDDIRGSLVAFDAETGKEAWRFWTVPGDPANGFESKALEMAAKTWTGKEWWRFGGGDVWDPITYDPVTGLLLFGTSRAGVGEGTDSHDDTPGGDKLFAGCIVAVKADTGEYVWHFQTSTQRFDTENFHIVVADLEINGKKRHVAMTAPKNGFFYVLDAKTGEFIKGNLLVKVPWAEALDPKTGRPLEMAGAKRGWTVHNWWHMSYSPATGLVYVPTTDRRAALQAPADGEEDQPRGEGAWAAAFDGRLVAWDPVSQSVRWSVEQPIAVNGSTLSTAGNLVFQGEGTGEFSAYAADSGKKLWSLKTGSAIDATPVSFSAGGQQYVVVPAGWGSASRIFGPASMMATPQSKRGPSRLLAFKLGGTTPFPYPLNLVPRVPKPPEQTFSKEIIGQGKVLYETHLCSGCHSPGLDGSGAWTENGAIPDLRYAPPRIHKEWHAIVLAGTHRDTGMLGFGIDMQFPNVKKLTVEDNDAIHAYVIDGAWKAYNAQQRASGDNK
jgi:quinohemoprotein ethanol dehydrogenase